MEEPVLVAEEFAAAMQQLSAEAARAVATSAKGGGAAASSAEVGALRSEVQALGARFGKFESLLLNKLEHLIDAQSLAPAAESSADFSTQFGKIAQQLDAIQKSETVNQKLFDSLHDELLAYRDNFLHESLQKPFIHDLVHLYDDLTSLSEQLQTSIPEGSASAARWRDNLENAIHSLLEILHRFEVKEIEPRENVDRAIHKVLSFEPADYAEEEGRIVMRVRRGFFWRGKLIRPEEVIAKRFN